MAKKVRRGKKIPTVKRVEELDYWKFRCLASELDNEKTKKKIAELQLQMEDLHSQIMLYKKMLIGHQIRIHEKEIEQNQSDYDKIKLEIEGKLGQSLNNCNIDPKEFTVHKGV